MRLVQFPHATRGGVFGNQVAYPDDVISGDVLEFDGSTLFGRCDRAQDDSSIMVGWYSGELPLADYTPPTRYRTNMTKTEFRSLFTQAEKVAIYTAAEASVEARIWLDDLRDAGDVDVTDQAAISGVSGLVTAGILTKARADEILKGVPL